MPSNLNGIRCFTEKVKRRWIFCILYLLTTTGFVCLICCIKTLTIFCLHWVNLSVLLENDLSLDSVRA